MTDQHDRREAADFLSEDELRRQAIAKWKKRVKETGPLPTEEPNIRELIHELQIHQIELEMQNEELRRVQAELDESRARYFDLYDLAPVGYCTISENGLILEANLTAASLLGVARRELFNQPLSRFIIKEDQDTYYLHRKQLFSTGSPQACEFRMLKKEGTYFWAYIDATTAQGANGMPVCRISMSDITIRKQEEAELLIIKEALEVANRKLQAALTREKQLSNTDVLTGLYNRRHLFELAANEFNVAMRYRHPLTIILFDVDDFKQINDTRGHTAGDKALEQFARAAAAQIRAVDVLARYGGDEFIILLPQTNALQAFPVAERIRESIAAQRVAIDKGILKVSASIGIAEIRHTLDGESIENIIQRADKALYTAKAAGRNRTAIYSE
jgi:diguanylate cyclase (GGDEF)-like protein/PAS domain S-box-containing protein